MATTYFPFTPNINTPFQFQPTLDGDTYNAVVTWNVFAQRYYINLRALDGTLTFSKPVVGSINWTQVQLTTTRGSQFASLAPAVPAEYLVAASDEYLVTDVGTDAFLVTSPTLPAEVLVEGVQLISSLVPLGTTITVAPGPIVSLSAAALATGTDAAASLNGDINIAAGYFTQQALVYRQAAARFEVYDIAQSTTLPGQSAFTAEGFPSGLVSPFFTTGPTGPTGATGATGPTGPPLLAQPPIPDGLATGSAEAPDLPGTPPNPPLTTSPLTTTKTNNVVVVYVLMQQGSDIPQPPASAIPSVATLTSPNLRFSRRFQWQFSPLPLGPQPAAAAIEIWWAPASDVLTNEVITAHFTGGILAGCISAVAINGPSLINPFDPGSTLPVVNSSNMNATSAPPAATGVSTSRPGTLVMLMSGSFSALDSGVLVCVDHLGQRFTDTNDSGSTGYQQVIQSFINLYLSSFPAYSLEYAAVNNASYICNNPTLTNWSVVVADALVNAM